MKINRSIIEKLNPCKDRFDNFLEHYSEFDGDLKDFIMLDKITYKDKVWVATRLFSKEQNVKWAILCASSVLSIFEEKYPSDKRPREAIEAAQKYLDEPTEENREAYAAYSASTAAHTAYTDAYASDASNAAYAASAAASAAHTAACTYESTAFNAASAAASYAADASDADAAQEELNLKLMLEVLSDE